MKILFLLTTFFGQAVFCNEVSYDDKILCKATSGNLKREIALFLTKVGHPMSGFNHEGIAVLKTESTMAALSVDWKFLDHKPIVGTINDKDTVLNGWTIEMKPVQGHWSKENKKDFEVEESPPTCGPIPCSPFPPVHYTANCQLVVK